MFVDLTAAYGTVWHHGLTCKLLKLLLDKHMVRMIMELIRNRSFTLTIGDSKQSRLQCLKNSVPQGSVLALLFNIYVYDLPSTVSRRYAYADDLALLYFSDDWKDLEGVLSQDMTTISTYLQTWRLQLSYTKTDNGLPPEQQRPNVSLMSTTMANACHSVQSLPILGLNWTDHTS